MHTLVDMSGRSTAGPTARDVAVGAGLDDPKNMYSMST